MKHKIIGFHGSNIFRNIDNFKNKIEEDLEDNPKLKTFPGRSYRKTVIILNEMDFLDINLTLKI